MAQDIVSEMAARELLVQVSDQELLTEHLSAEPRTVYCGFDPTADSLHIGHLVPLLALRRFQLAGHRPIYLMGGATGLIGDPSFKDDERSLNESSVVSGWVEKIERQVAPFLDFDGPTGAIVANNLDWTASMDVVTYLRDIGKHFSVNAMIQRESVRSRLERDDQGISYTEFSYLLLQAMDYLELARRYGCSLQIGGSDQWGNIVSGMDLVRRNLKQSAFALTLPLIAKADGTKFGKTAGDAVWLDPAKTSPYAFYQFWLNTADADAIRFLKIFTFMEIETIDAMAADLASAPERRTAQMALAEAVTEFVHGADAVVSAQRISKALFGGQVEDLTERDLEQLRLDGMSATECSAPTGLLSALADTGLAESKGQARKLVGAKGVRVNGVVRDDIEAELDFSDALFGRYYLLRRGKKSWHLLVRPTP